MASYKEIVTKAVVGKTKKNTKDEIVIETDTNVDTVLGCWVINNTFSGHNNRGKVNIDGSYDVNVWYSFDNNTKTNVLVRTFNYQDNVNVKLRNDANLTNTNEIIVRSLSAPSVTNVNIDGTKIHLNVEKELGVEIIGDTKVRIAVEDDFDDYEVESEENTVETNELDIDEDYLNSVNQ
ncbi:MAG: outer spore coat protein CotE [Mollicutes bacterium]|nr:outer spore coat protein CotE [Mollicutes bacterium]